MPDALRPQGPHDRLVAWMLSRDTGLSSLAMARTLAPRIGYHGPFRNDPIEYPRIDHPVDIYDLGWCIGLLDAVPELREHLPAMAGVSPVWARIVPVWGELEAMYRANPRAFYSVREMLKKLEAMHAG